MSGDRVRLDVHYTGRVQGVGFRWRTSRIAAGRSVVGFVRNLPDGRVHLVVEAERAEAEEFLAAVRREMGSLVRNEARSEQVPGGCFEGFTIRR